MWVEFAFDGELLRREEEERHRCERLAEASLNAYKSVN
jgi:hypothetical protein